MNPADPEKIVGLLTEGMGLFRRILEQQERKLDLLLERDPAAIEQSLSTDQEDLRELRLWKHRLGRELSGHDLSQLILQQKGPLGVQIDSCRAQLRRLVADLRFTNTSNDRYMQTSLGFIRALLQNILGDSPGYDQSGHLHTSPGVSHKSVTVQL